jgi:ketol-acid reductoisomerase
MSVIYHESDADRSALEGRKVGIIGYGNLGRPVALNMRDSGLDLLVGMNDQATYERAVEDGMTIAPIEQIVEVCDILLLLVPDESMPRVYLHKISPLLRKGQTLIFASAYNIAFGYIEPPSFVDVGLIAPRTFGEAVRQRYENGQGFYTFVAAGQDATGTIWQTILALASAMGSLKAGALEITMEQEAELDLFVQQAILPAMHRIMTTAADVLLGRGYPAEAVMMDLYISGEVSDYLQWASEMGLLHALRRNSLTGQFGTFSRLERFNDLKLERLMEVTLDDIRQGNFSREWEREYNDGYPRLRKLLQAQERMDLWDIEQQTIDMLRPRQFMDDFDDEA